MIQQSHRPLEPARLRADRFPLLITGIPGVPGYNALDYFRARYPGQVIGIRQQDNWRLNGEGIVACDAEDPRQLARLFDQYQFRSVLDCAGNCALRACELCPEIAWRINVEGLRNFLATIGDGDIRLVHLSCDLVFSGNRPGDYREDDPTDPVTVYGTTMAASEQLLLEKNPAACTLRISLPMGVSFSGHAGAIDWIQSRFRKSKPATLYFDEIRTPTYTDCLNELYETMLGNDLSGIYHAGGPRRLTLYQIAQVINRVGGYAPEHVMGCLRHQAGPIPPRAGDVSMDSSKLTSALGYNPIDPWPLSEDLVPTHHDWHHDRPHDQLGSLDMLHQVLCRNPSRRGGPPSEPRVEHH